MNYFVIRVSPRNEEKFLTLSRSRLKEFDKGSLFFPRRKMAHWKAGVKKEVEIPLFPGYVFFKSDEVNPDIYWALKRTGGFLHFLKNAEKVSALSGKDLEVLKHFLSYGEVIERSAVVFDENQRIQVISGPLSGLEGNITKVDRRKGRAKVMILFQNNPLYIDLAFEDINALAVSK